jgi:hypothetical protein
MSNILTEPMPSRPRLSRPPLIAPAANLRSYTVIASDGKGYRLTPNGKQSWQTEPGKPYQSCVTFQYRRIDQDGKLIKRVRMSKKNRLRLKRAVSAAA